MGIWFEMMDDGLLQGVSKPTGLWGIIVTHNNRDTCLPLSIMGWDRIGVFHGSDGDGSKKEVSKPEMLGHFWDSATPIYMGQVVNFDPHHKCLCHPLSKNRRISHFVIFCGHFKGEHDDVHHGFLGHPNWNGPFLFAPPWRWAWRCTWSPCSQRGSLLWFHAKLSICPENSMILELDAPSGRSYGDQ